MKVLKPLLVILIILLSSISIYSQNNLNDSLQNILDKANSEEEYIDISIEIVDKILFSEPEIAKKLLITAITKAQQLEYAKGLGFAYARLGVSYAITKNPSLAENYYEQAIIYLQLLPDKLPLGKIYNNLGLLYKNIAKFSESLENFQKAEAIAENLNAKELLHIIYNNEGIVYRHLGDFEEAIKSFLLSTNIKEELGDDRGLAVTKVNIANLYASQGRHELSRKVYIESLEIFRRLDEEIYMGGTLTNIASSYLYEENLPAAIVYYDSAKVVYENINYQDGIAITQMNLARIYHQNKNYVKAIGLANKALNTFEESNAQSSVTSAYLVIAETFLKLDELDSAFKYTNNAIDIALKVDDTKKLIDGYRLMYEYHELKGNLEDALFYHKKYTDLSDNYFNIEKNKQITEIMASHQLEKKEKENEVLRQMYYRKEAENKALIGAVLFFFMFTTYFYHANEAQRRHNQLLISQNSDIYGKQENILAINRSLLNSQQITEALNEKLKIINADLEEQVADRTRRLAQANKELDTFLYQSSHALRRPIVNILGLVKIARIEPEIDKVPDVYDKIDETSYKMDGMLKKLVMVSEINSLKLKLDRIDFAKMTTDILHQLQPTIEAKGIDFNFCIENNIEFVSDKRLMDLILFNIMENAVNFSFPMPDRPSFVNMKITQLNDKGINIFIEDNGIGILKEAIGTVFEMFAVADNKSRGYGLGLYIVKKAVDKLNGSNYISSKKFENTVVKIDLPRPENSKSKKVLLQSNT